MYRKSPACALTAARLPRDVCFCRVGEKFDGHDFIDTALAARSRPGCLCAKLPRDLRPDKFYIKVDDTRLALRALASAYRDKFRIPFVQITGSVGKTTTKEIVRPLWEQSSGC